MEEEPRASAKRKSSQEKENSVIFSNNLSGWGLQKNVKEQPRMLHVCFAVKLQKLHPAVHQHVEDKKDRSGQVLHSKLNLLSRVAHFTILHIYIIGLQSLKASVSVVSTNFLSAFDLAILSTSPSASSQRSLYQNMSSVFCCMSRREQRHGRHSITVIIFLGNIPLEGSIHANF